MLFCNTNKPILRAVSVVLICGLLLSGISVSSYAVTDTANKFTLAPPLATQSQGNALLRNEWIVAEIGKLIYPILKLTQDGKLQNPIAILIPHVKKNTNMAEILLRGFNIDGIQEVREGQAIIGFSLPVTRNGTPAYRLIYNLQGGEIAIQMRDGAKVYAEVIKDAKDVPVPGLAGELGSERKLVDEIHSRWPPAITIFGSARIPQSDPIFKKAKELGAAIFRQNIPVRTGAGPSMMEAPFIGYIEEREKSGAAKTPQNMTQGIRILGLSSDQKTSEYVEDNYDFKHFVIRKMGLYNNCLGIAVFPGEFGTMDEFFEVWSRKLPTVLIGKSYWQPIIDAAYENWRKKGWLEMIEEKPFITDSVDEAMDHLRRAKGRAIKESAKTMETAVKDMESALRTIRGWQPAVVIIGQSELSDNAEADIIAGITSKLLANDIPVRSATANQYLREALEKAAGDKKETLQAVLTVPEGTVVKERPNRIVTHYVSNHHVLITENARAFVFLPGRAKTLNRLFDIVAVMQTGKIEKRPIILIDRKFWQPIKDAIVTAALEYPTAKLIKPEDAELLHIVDTADEAIRIIRTMEKKTGERSEVLHSTQVVTSVPAPAGRGGATGGTNCCITGFRAHTCHELSRRTDLYPDTTAVSASYCGTWHELDRGLQAEWGRKVIRIFTGKGFERAYCLSEELL